MKGVLNMSVLKRFSLKWSWQSVIVSLCILAVCVGTQQIQTVAWNTGIIEFSRDSLGVLMALILFTNYSRKDFLKYKFVYLAWGILGLLLGVILVPMAIKQRIDFLAADTIVIAAGIYLMGFCIIHTVISLFIEKNRPRLYLPLTVIWIVMLILMITSRSDYLWPECYFVLFLTYYLTPQSASQRRNTVVGLINGLILSYILIQAHSLLFRPYDVLRYCGNFCNPNNNSVFLCFCLAAILAKILFAEKEGRGKLEKVFYFLLAGSCYSFICMTICRSGYLTVFVLTVFFLIAYCKIKKKKIFFRMGLLLVSIFIVSFPLTYLAVRYIPTIHPHVLFYFQEGYSTSRVHSWDSRDSEKFITFGQLIEGIFGRFGTLVQPQDGSSGDADANVGVNTGDFGNAGANTGNFRNAGADTGDSGNAGADTGNFGNLGDSLKIAAAEDYFPSGIHLYAMADADKAEDEQDPDKIPLLTPEEAANPLLVRYTIYKWYITHLSLRGMPYDEQGFQLSQWYWVQSTHNIYLDYGINFGIPVMILFAVFIWWGIGRLTKRGMQKQDEVKLACLFIVLIPPVFGMFELAWGAGMISTVALYLAFKEMLGGDEPL